MWMIRNKTKMTLAKRSRGKLVIMMGKAREPSGEGAVIVDDDGGGDDDCFGNGGGQYG